MKLNSIVNLSRDGSLKLPPEVLAQLSPNTSFEISVTEEEIIFKKIVKTENKNSVNNLTIVSQKSLAKDWLKSEEDAAWQDL